MTDDTVFIVDDEQSVRDALSVLVKTRLKIRALPLSGASEAIEALSRTRPAVVISDVFMEEAESGVTVLLATRKAWPDVPVILMSAVATKEAAIKALNAQAFHFLQKPFGNDELLRVLNDALKAGGARKEAGGTGRAARSRRHNQPMERKNPEEGAMIGQSDAWLEAVDLCEAAARTDMTVLLEGESGTGKSLLASHIHHSSHRTGKEFLAVNCGALTETLLESQLFGHVKGAFTGADRENNGMIRAADGGTLFLDEIGETSKATQVRLLHVLQDKEVIPVGDTRPYKANVRFVAATNKTLRTEVLEGRFREDLFYRLNVIGIRVPPLRERKADLGALCDHILKVIRDDNPGLRPEGLSQRAMEAVMKYNWPGNIRELENALAQAAVRSRGIIDADDLPEHVRVAQGEEERV